MIKLTLFIPGIPQPKQSARFRIAGNPKLKQFIQSYQSKEVKENERSIKMIVREQLPKGFTCHSGPIEVTRLEFSFPPLKSMKKSERLEIERGGVIPKTTKPDLTDNLMKGLFDAMEGLVYTNDSLIFRVGSIRKVYSNTPGTGLEIILH